MSFRYGNDRADNVRRQLDDFFNPNTPAKSFRSIYGDITGDVRCTGLYRNCDPQRLREAAGPHFREAVNSGTFSQILGDAITRAMVREYSQGSAYADWRSFCDTVLVTDFRTQRRGRLGGYGNLPAVAENGPYGALTTPTDEEATYAVSKRGGTETISLEAIANDDVGLIRRIPLALARAANRTLYEYVTDFFKNNPAIYDGDTLFHANHANLGAAALDNTSFAAARLAMRKQTEGDSNKPLGLSLKHLVVPLELEEAAYDLFQRTTNNDKNFVNSINPEIHVVPHWTDTNNWFATADKAEVPLLELGFYGSEEPELFIADAPTGGSMFSNDQMVVKVRHIYNATVLDYRGFYGATVA